MHARFLLPATVMLFAPVALVGGAVYRGPEYSRRDDDLGVDRRAGPTSGAVERDDRGRAYLLLRLRARTSRCDGDRRQLVRRRRLPADQAGSKDLAAGRSYFVEILKPDDKLPTYNGAGVYVVINSLGVAGVGAGLEVTMIDPPSLGDPIGARLVLPPDAQYRVGHAYKPVVWAKARYTAASVYPDDERLNDARAALACGDIPTLISAITEPLSPAAVPLQHRARTQTDHAADPGGPRRGARRTLPLTGRGLLPGRGARCGGGATRFTVANRADTPVPLASSRIVAEWDPTKASRASSFRFEPGSTLCSPPRTTINRCEDADDVAGWDPTARHPGRAPAAVPRQAGR